MPRPEQREALSPRQATVLVIGVAVLLTAYRMALIPTRGITLFVDEAYYWDWSRELAFGYFTKPPMIAWLIAAGTNLWGDSVLGVKAAAMLLYPVTAWVIYRLGRELSGPACGAVAALVFIASPLAGILGLAASTDAPLLLCWSLAAWALWRALARTDAMAWRPWVGVGLAVGVGLLSKYTMVAFVLGVLPLLWVSRRQPGVWAGAVLAAVVAAVVFTPHLVWNALHGTPTLRHTAEITTGSAHAGGAAALAEFVLGQSILLGPLALVPLVMAARRWRGEAADPRLRFLLALTVPLFAVAGMQAWHAGANLNWAAPAFIGAALLLGRWVTQPDRPTARRWTVAIVASNLLLVGLVCHARDIATLSNLVLPERADLFARMRGWDAAFGALAPAVQAHRGWPLIADGRALSAHAAYQWRDLQVRPQALRAGEAPRDQYELTTDASRHAGADVLLLGERGPPARLASRCESTAPLGQVSVPIGPRREVALTLVACRGWLTRAEHPA
jgi:4-amino-4-deoxy-L-arabinose transferase-like glycosyltransferase